MPDTVRNVDSARSEGNARPLTAMSDVSTLQNTPPGPGGVGERGNRPGTLTWLYDLLPRQSLNAF